jgi:hypothetical protein
MNSTNPDEQPSDDSLSSGTSIPTIIVCNAVSILACLVTLSIYGVLSMKGKYKRLMRRRTLVLAACMASSDLVLHVGDVPGYVLRNLTLHSALILPGTGLCHQALCVHSWEAGCSQLLPCCRYSTLVLLPSTRKLRSYLDGDLPVARSPSSFSVRSLSRSL